jgi:hypothetical protein
MPVAAFEPHLTFSPQASIPVELTVPARLYQNKQRCQDVEYACRAQALQGYK